MKRIVAFLCAAALFGPAASAASAPSQPPVPPAKPVTETLFGHKITDRYRYFEQQDASVTDWMKAEGRYTRSVLDSLPQHDAILQRLSAMTGSMDVVQSISQNGGAHLLRAAKRRFGQFRPDGSRFGRPGAQAGRRCRDPCRKWRRAVRDQLFQAIGRRHQGRGRNLPRRIGRCVACGFMTWRPARGSPGRFRTRNSASSTGRPTTTACSSTC